MIITILSVCLAIVGTIVFFFDAEIRRLKSEMHDLKVKNNQLFNDKTVLIDQLNGYHTREAWEQGYENGQNAMRSKEEIKDA